MVMKDMKQLEEYYLSLKIHSVAQGLTEPLDLMYVYSTDEEKQLFHLKQDFLFGVFVAMMKVSQLHSVKKEHTNDLDVQKVHVALLELLQESTHANVKSADILVDYQHPV
jgi:hypothetical protein